jgi:16S rRNA (cytidine1402-2'-O)-methyltransferase
MPRRHSPAPSLKAEPAPPRYLLAGKEVDAPRLAAGLHIVATPIGNLRDITLRALETLAAADLIACEDTRITSRLLNHYGIKAPLTSYHDHNAGAARPRLLEALAQGSAIALVSDAGTPLISDPGYKLVRAAREAGYSVTTVPGASSVLAALAIAGLPTDRFWFEGFLPAKPGARRKRLGELARVPGSLVLFETGNRLAASLADLAGALGSREAAICRELTKLHEEVRDGHLGALAEAYAGEAETRGEFVLVIAPPQEADAVEAGDIDSLLRESLGRVSVKDAVAEVSEATGQPRKDVYRRALALIRQDGDAPP